MGYNIFMEEHTLGEFSLNNPNRPCCKQCNKGNFTVRRYNTHLDGTKRYYWTQMCTTCERKKYKQTKFTSKRKYRRTKQNAMKCTLCPFIAKYPCQLDVDHINGDHFDNRPENLQVICSNCHRAKTYEQLHKK